LVSAGLPEPAVQHVVTDSNEAFVARVDLAYPNARLAIEYDSYQEHTGKIALIRDSSRRNALVATGWTVLSATAADLQRNCRTLIRDVRRVLDREAAPSA
jgi:very-short-patch-repair endonuclease